MAIGKGRHRIILQRETKTADGGGGHSVVWENVATVWAHITPLAGREGLRAQALETPVTHRMMIRYRSGLDGAFRIKKGDRLFNVISIIDRDERKRWLEIQAVEGSAT